MQAPGAGLELQLAEFDVEGAAALLLALELGEQLSRLVLRGDEPERADDENQEEEEVQLRHASGPVRKIVGSKTASVRSAARSVALRARGLAATSAGAARRALPRILSGACGRSRARIGKSTGRRSWLQACRKRLTRRSSSEWKAITASRPPGARRAAAWGSISATSSSSRLTRIRRA